ncbi:MAG: endonuclease/exonuclease/phosphatase family protein [Melioribacteraceae bacterium]|nr:T9SS type A sorting domain-containing protein [Melioribacteraceae bacterium]MDD3559299.1 endonuclease/exonuclease/phosphatase family protein [Melioribacteraceae bacterium]
MRKISKNIISLLLLFILSLQAQEKVKIMTYNLLQYPNNYASRNEYFQTVVATVNPDIIVVQEMKTNAGFNMFASQVLDGSYSAGDFNENDFLNNAIYYKTNIFQFISNVAIPTVLRDINQFTLVHKITADTIIIYSVHLKSSQGYEQQRLSEVNSLREVTDRLQSDANYIVLGDFNIYTSNEPAFQRLLDQSAAGYFLDPLNAPGDWNNNPNFAYLHTQSTRYNNIGDGGASGGLDDRFDMILISQSVLDYGGIDYIEGTYKPIGNDGAHFNKSINELPNNAVSAEVANALFFASDHLPVAAEFYFGVSTSVDEFTIPTEIELSQNYPNPFNPETTINFTIPKPDYIKLIVSNLLGETIEIMLNDYIQQGSYDISFDGGELSSGIYFYSLISSGSVITKKMMLIK